MFISKNLRTYSLLFLVFLMACSCQKKLSAVQVDVLSVEYLKNPIGIDKLNPILSWKLIADELDKSQSAYQILVASSNELLLEDTADIWNSGKVNSHQNLNIKYGGQSLLPNTKYFWKLRIWDEKAAKSKWSAHAFWQTGMLKKKDWKAKWISNKYAPVTNKREPFSQYDDTRTFVSNDSSAMYLRKKFVTKGKISKATAYVSGLGYYELYFNGKRVGDHVLDPVFTDYQKTVKYFAYDVTSFLESEKQNTVAAILGNGFYNHNDRDLFQMEKANWKTPPKLLCQIMISYETGETELVLTDTSWKWSYGPIVYNSIRGGESIDARIDFAGWNETNFDDSLWKPTLEVPEPIGKLSYQYMPPLRETKSFQPITKWSPKENITVFDFGENLTGYADIILTTEKGKQIDIYFNEVLKQDSTLNKNHSSGHTWGRFQHGKLIGSGGLDKFRPRFTYHGLRYVQIEGVPSSSIASIRAWSVHTDLQEIGSFECSNPRLNQMHAAVKRTLLNSVHSMPGEEPTREKMGWTFDAGMVTMESYLYNFDAINTYKKYLQDLIDAQENNGHVPPIVPTNGWGLLENSKDGKETPIPYDDPWWGGTLIYVADKLYEATGDTTIIRKSYNAMKDYANFVMSTAQNEIIYWSLGDWLDLTHGSKGWGPGLTPIELTSTAASYYFCERLSTYAKILGKNSDLIAYTNHAQRIKKRFNQKFLNIETGWYTPNSQTAQAVPLYLGLVPEDMKAKVSERLLDAIRDNNYHTSVGFIGVNPMLKYLSQNGYKYIAFKMVMQEESPGWLHFVKNEKSTMGENLNAQGYGTSHHPFAANIGFWLYNYLGGIQVDRSQAQEIILSPGFETDVKWANCSYNALKGKVVSNWKKNEKDIDYYIDIPMNTTALLKLPEGYSLNKEAEAWKYNKGGYIVPSGSYAIKVNKNL